MEGLLMSLWSHRNYVDGTHLLQGKTRKQERLFNKLKGTPTWTIMVWEQGTNVGSSSICGSFVTAGAPAKGRLVLLLVENKVQR